MSDNPNKTTANEWFQKIIAQQNETIQALQKDVKTLQTTSEVESIPTQTKPSESKNKEITLTETFKNIYQKMKEAK